MAAAVDGPPSASPLLAPHPRGPSGMVHSRRTCHCHSGGDGSRSVRAKGWVGGKREGSQASSTACHCSAAAAAAPKPHREQTPPPPRRHNFTPKTPRGPLPFTKVKRLPWFAGGCVAARAGCRAPPLRIRSRAITVLAEVTSLPQRR